MPLNDAYLADVLIERLNGLIQNPAIREDIGKLIETRVPCSKETLDHPTIQAGDEGVGFLGILNGLVGTIPEGPKKGWGFIAAEFSDDGKLERFQRTDAAKSTP
jgi:hypothetical protein